MRNTIASVGFAISMLSAICQPAFSEVDVMPSVGLPKLFLDDKYIHENALHGAEFSALSGSTVTLVSLGDGKTIVIGPAGQIVTVDKEIPGQFSEFETSVAAGVIPDEVAKSTSEQYNVLGLDTIGIPTFAPRTEIVWNTGPSEMGSVAYKGEKDAIYVSIDSNWQKKLLSDGMALYITKLNFSSRKYFEINDLPLNYSLRSADGQVYPALEPDSGLFSKIRSKFSGQANKMPKECENAISKVTLKPFGKASGLACVIAPADDFSLVSYFGGSIPEMGYRDDFKPGPKWKEQFPFYYDSDFDEKIVAKYLLRAKSALTIAGYNKNLSVLAYLYYKLGNPTFSLAIAEHLLAAGYVSDRIPLRLLKILDLIQLNRLGASANTLQSAGETGSLEIYRKYLMSSSLREMEVLSAVSRTARADELKEKLSSMFLRNTDLSPDVDDALIARITSKAAESYEQQFHSALGYFRNHDYAKAGMILEYLAAQNIKGSNLGPAILDLLGWVYLNEREYPKAIAVYERMETAYPKEEFVGPFDGEGYYAGPGGAEGLKWQLFLYGAPWRSVETEKFKPDCEKALEAAKKLISRYPGVVAKCYEGCGTYSALAMWVCRDCLNNTHVTTNIVEQKINGLLALVSGEDLLIARTKTDIARQYQKENDYTSAIRIFREVVEKYPESNLIDEMDGVIEFYGLDALAAIIDMRRSQGASTAEIEKVQKEFEKLYNRFGDIGGKNMQNFMPKMLKAKYLRYMPTE